MHHHRPIQRGISAVFVVIFTLALAIASATAYFTFSQNLTQKNSSINSFEDCAKHYPVMESYPEQCKTPDGKHFTRQLNENEKQRLSPSLVPSTVNMKTDPETVVSNFYDWQIDCLDKTLGDGNTSTGIEDCDPSKSNLVSGNLPNTFCSTQNIPLRENIKVLSSEVKDQSAQVKVTVNWDNETIPLEIKLSKENAEWKIVKITCNKR